MLYTGSPVDDCTVPSNMTAMEFTEFIWTTFPALNGKAFGLYQSKANGQLYPLSEVTTPAMLKCNRARKCIYVIPCEPITTIQNVVSFPTRAVYFHLIYYCIHFNGRTKLSVLNRLNRLSSAINFPIFFFY